MARAWGNGGRSKQRPYHRQLMARVGQRKRVVLPGNVALAWRDSGGAQRGAAATIIAGDGRPARLFFAGVSGGIRTLDLQGHNLTR